MDPIVQVALIGMIVPALALLGKGGSYIIGLVQDKGKTALEAKNTELEVKDERIEILEEKVSERDDRIAYLETRLREKGVTT
jgi:hypothetical protein